MSLKSVAVVIISDEILHNKQENTISNFLLEELNSLHYIIGKLVILPEVKNLIYHELEMLAKYCDIIIAVGGVKNGVVYRAVGDLFSQELERSEELSQLLLDIHEPHGEDEVKIPLQAKIIHGNGFPVINLQRIFILKESYAEDSFSNILKHYLAQYKEERVFTKIISIHSSVVNFDNIQSNHRVRVEHSKNGQCITLKMSSCELSHLIEFEKSVIQCEHLDYDAHYEDDLNIFKGFYSSHDSHVKNAIENIEKGLDEYGPENVFVSFNGGKDCTVLLHLILTTLKTKYPEYKNPLLCLYVQSKDAFSEQDDFIAQCKVFYNLEIITVQSSIKTALEVILQRRPNCKACFMGTRRTDPFSQHLNVFQMTDSNWPQIMRVSPLLDWHYTDIWNYLLFYKVPYCKLYDEGYTSLGNTKNTTRNPSLVYRNVVDGKETYLPAYKLLKEKKERNGRCAS